jgi:hypothetical protein
MKKILTLAAALCLCAVSSQAQVILHDSFTYADGLTTVVSSNTVTPNLGWTNYSGAVDSKITSGRLEVQGGRAGDIARIFTNTTPSTIYASFVVNATNVVGLSNYFAHFLIYGTTTFKGRIFAVGNSGTTPNTWRLGMTAAAGGSPKVFPLDLATNVDYRVTFSYDNASLFLGTLWVDAVSPSDANVQTSDSTTTSALNAFAFRQPTSATTAPNLTIDDLYVGNSFTDVNVGATKSPTVYYQPAAGPATIFTGGSYALTCVAGGAGTVSFLWQHAGTNLVDDANYVGSTSNKLTLVNAVVGQSGNYKCIVVSTTNYVFSGSITSSVAQVTVSAAPVPPSFIAQPVSQSVYRGQTVVFSTTVASPGNVSYQWFSNNVALAGETASTLTLANLTTNYSTSTYKVSVTNDVVSTGIVSTNAVLTVSNPPAVSVGFLRKLVDSSTFLPTASLTQPYEVTGVITTFTNITTGNTASYFLQDGTGGINIFATLGSTFRPAQGDSVTYVGVLSSFTSGLELVADPAKPYTSYTIVSSGNPLPTAKTIPMNFTNAYGYTFVNTNLAGSLVTITNVYFGTNNAVVLPAANYNATVTNAAGQSIVLNFFSLDADTVGQTLPEYATSVTGVLYGLHPNYSLAVTKFSDIVAGTLAPTPIPITTSLSGNNLSLSWDNAAFYLQAADEVAGPYGYISGATSPFVIDVTVAPHQFYRLTSTPPPAATRL